MTPRTRNLIVWTVVVAVAAGVWFFAARIRLHFIDPRTFLVVVAVAAATLAALLWWEIASGPDDKPQPAPDPDDAPQAARTDANGPRSTGECR